MSNTKQHRPNYCFIFQSPVEAKQFFEFANSRNDTHLVQHPYASDGSGKKLHHQVLVTGTGSFLFDANMKSELEAKAHELGGNLMPK